MRQAHLRSIARYALLIRRIGKWQQSFRVSLHSQNFRLFHTRKHVFKSSNVDDNSNLYLRKHAKSNEIRTLQNGLVHLKGALSPEEQIELSEMVLELGADKERGFWSTDQEDQKVLNSTPHRGRMFDVEDELPRDNQFFRGSKMN